MNRLFICLFVMTWVAFSASVQTTFAGPVLSSDYLAGATTEGAVRYRDLGNTNANPDIYLGVGDLGVAANRVEKNYYGGTDSGGTARFGSWLNSPTSNHVVFTYDKANDRLITDVTSQYSYELIYNNFTANRPNPAADLNYLQFGLRGSATGTVTLQNILLDGNSLSDIASLDGTYKNWYISGYDFNNGFTLSADMVLTGTLSKAESSKVDISFGNAQTVVPEPASFTVLSLACGSLLLRRSRRKNRLV